MEDEEGTDILLLNPVDAADADEADGDFSETVELRPPVTVPSNIANVRGSNKWFNILHQLSELNAKHWFLHLTASFFPFMIDKNEHIYESWPRIIKWFVIFQSVILFLSLAWIAVLIGAVISGGFNVSMVWETDFVVNAAYPAALNRVGTVAVAWFLLALFLWKFLITCIYFLPQHLFFRWILNQISHRYDLWTTIIQSITIPLLSLVVAGAIGITNLFLLMAIVLSTMFYVIFTSYLPGHTAFKLLSLMLRYPIVYYERSVEAGGLTGIRMYHGQSGYDYPSRAIDGSLMNNHMGGAYRDPLEVGKLFADHLSSAVTAEPESSTAAIVAKPATQVLKNTFSKEISHVYVTGVAISRWFFNHRDITIVVPSLLWLTIIIVIPITYFAYGEAHGSSYVWWEIAPLWILLPAFLFHYFLNSFYWSPYNRIIRVNKVLSKETGETVEKSRLFISAFAYNMLSNTLWTVVECLVAFIILGGGWNMPAPTTFFA